MKLLFKDYVSLIIPLIVIIVMSTFFLSNKKKYRIHIFLSINIIFLVIIVILNYQLTNFNNVKISLDSYNYEPKEIEKDNPEYSQKNVGILVNELKYYVIDFDNSKSCLHVSVNKKIENVFLISRITNKVYTDFKITHDWVFPEENLYTFKQIPLGSYKFVADNKNTDYKVEEIDINLYPENYPLNQVYSDIAVHSISLVKKNSQITAQFSIKFVDKNGKPLIGRHISLAVENFQNEFIGFSTNEDGYIFKKYIQLDNNPIYICDDETSKVIKLDHIIDGKEYVIKL
ncbi:hypothetical protein [Coprobacillus cateniformis]|mgnify:CR=1 FL=1|uniref:hypothetical protein n=1 Tax=Coprobacillus cateniformis TaxID=100884 RepID=UPI00136554E7|nr:hypothetical protein [Coprobacillus cateniformis]